MRKISLIITFSLISCSFFGQKKLDVIINNEIKKLEASNSSFLIMKEYCVGHERSYDHNSKCDVEEYLFQIFIIWDENNKTKVTKYDNCKVYKAQISTENGNPWIFTNANLEKLKLEKILPYTLEDNSSIGIDHSCLYRFIIKINGSAVDNSFDGFDLTNENDNENINFKSNNTLAIVELKKLILNLNQKVLIQE